MQDWQTKTGTVTFVNIDGTTTTVKTLKQIESEAQAQLDTYHPFPWAMRKVEFEARRAANNEKFAASGFVHNGKHQDDGVDYIPIGEGFYSELRLSNLLRMGVDSEGTDKGTPDFPVVNIAGVTTHLVSLGDIHTSRVNFPAPEDGTRTYDTETDISTRHASPAIAFASETDTNKVVTKRVDMWGLEAFIKEITDSDPFVYPNGLVQSKQVTLCGVATETDTFRPDTYFSWHSEESGKTGRGVNWQTATEQERIAIASDPKNNIFFDDETGSFYQWCVRCRSFAGTAWP